MSDNEMLYCLVAFILGWLTSQMMGNGFRVGGQKKGVKGVGGVPCDNDKQCESWGYVCRENTMFPNFMASVEPYICDHQTPRQCSCKIGWDLITDFDHPIN